MSTASYLKDNQAYRNREAAIFARLYGNLPLFGAAGSVFSRMISTSQQLPMDRPTMNVIQSCVDTLLSRIAQAKPRPVFLTDAGSYKERTLAKQLNTFSQGEFYRMKAYDVMADAFRDSEVLGTGCVKIFEGQDNKCELERVLATELFVDANDAMYKKPRQLIQLKLVDRSVLTETYPDHMAMIEAAEAAYVDTGSDSSKTIADQVMVVEGWHLRSGPKAKDGRHTLAIAGCAEPLFDEQWDKDAFPFVFLRYNSRMLGFWGQSLAEQLMGTQLEINKLLITISQSINLVGVPRIFVEDGSKVVKAHLNNQVGSIVTYQGTKPQYEVAPCVPAEMYSQLQRLVDYAYQQSGISSLAATSKKPAGLDSGAALREYDDLQSDRFAATNKAFDQAFIDLAYLNIDLARDIAIRDGHYSTVYPAKDGTRQVDLPKAKLLKDNPYVIQCFDSSSLPRDPAGRKQQVIEYMQAGVLNLREGRRLLDFPDLAAEEKLANAMEERILQYLDEIIEDGKYTPPDPFMDADLAIELSNQYYNLYMSAKLEEAKAEMLRTFNAQAVMLKQAAMPPPVPGGMPGQAPQLASPEAPPSNPMLPFGQ